jgi:hypothetical protein
MLTSARKGRSTPASAAAVSGLRLSCATSPSYSISTSDQAAIGDLAGELAELFGEPRKASASALLPP